LLVNGELILVKSFLLPIGLHLLEYCHSCEGSRHVKIQLTMIPIVTIKKAAIL